MHDTRGTNALAARVSGARAPIGPSTTIGSYRRMAMGHGGEAVRSAARTMRVRVSTFPRVSPRFPTGTTSDTAMTATNTSGNQVPSDRQPHDRQQHHINGDWKQDVVDHRRDEAGPVVGNTTAGRADVMGETATSRSLDLVSSWPIRRQTRHHPSPARMSLAGSEIAALASTATNAPSARWNQ